MSPLKHAQSTNEDRHEGKKVTRKEKEVDTSSLSSASKQNYIVSVESKNSDMSVKEAVRLKFFLQLAYIQYRFSNFH